MEIQLDKHVTLFCYVTKNCYKITWRVNTWRPNMLAILLIIIGYIF